MKHWTRNVAHFSGNHSSPELESVEHFSGKHFSPELESVAHFSGPHFSPKSEMYLARRDNKYIISKLL